MADTHTHAPETAHVDHTSGHPTWRTYVVVGFILTAITGLEVVPALLTLSAIKFAIVVLFYMHLKFDDRLFSRVFVAPLFLAALVVIGMIILFKVLPGLELS
jgi:heme/copper-type cytochrome/quinol oxidase subunit 4